jgi:hypothetical protein
MISKDYSDKLSKFSQTVEIAKKVSKLGSGRYVKDIKLSWACILHTKICVTSTSLLLLAPPSKKQKNEPISWDFSSMFSLTRNLVECYQTLYYLCIDNISDDERLARKKLFNLHDYYSRKKLLSFINKPIGDVNIETDLRNELTKTEYFKKLEERQQKHFLKGDNAFFITREEIEEKMGSDINSYKMFYKLFSSNTHSYPMGFFGMIDGKRGTGIETEVEVKYSTLALQIAEEYLSESTKNIITLFPDIESKLNEKENNHLK